MSSPKIRCRRALAAVAAGSVLCASPAGAMPDRLAWQEELGTGVQDVAVSEDGVWVGLLEDGANAVWILDTRTWELESAEPCSETTGGLALLGEEDPWSVYVGCSDGTVVELEIDETEGLSTTDVSYEVSDQAILAIEGEGEVLYVISEQEEDDPEVHMVDLAEGTVDPDDYDFPTTFGYSGFEDSHLVEGYLIVAHGGDDVSKVTLDSASIATSDENLGGRDMVDLYAWETVVMLADTSGGVLQFNTGDNEYYILLDTEHDLESLQSLAVDASSDDPGLAVYDVETGEVVVFPFDITTGYPDDDEYTRYEAEDIADMVEAQGYLVGGGSSGYLQVLTDRPWITVEGLSDSAAVDGDEVTLTFSVDTDCDWEVYLGGTVADWDGEELGSGSAEADEEVEFTFTVDSDFAEGENALLVRAEDSSGLEGRAGATIDVDNPPGQVSLDADSLGFGDSQLTLEFEGLDDEDLASYDIYITVTEFDPGDYDSGGPAFDGDDDIENPLQVEDPEPDEDVIATISPLTNDVTYYVAVRAVDESDQEGEMSDVVSGTPQETMGSAELAGDDGGYCTAARLGSWGPGAFMLGLFGLLGRMRRRSRPGSPPRRTQPRGGRTLAGPKIALSVTAALAVPLAAHAQSSDYEEEQPSTALELRYGPFLVEDTNIETVYDDTFHGVLWAEAGPKLGRFFELDLGFGFYQVLSTTVSVDDQEHSSEHTMLTAWPVTAGATVRLDAFEEQIAVPRAAFGFDYWLWRENWYVNPDETEDADISGGKGGYHWAVGLEILLDAFDQGRASRLQMSTGIKDSYLVAEYRQQRIGQWDADGGLTFHGQQFGFGLRFDF